jgi:L-ascorbate metabolism protein UlaG (beta-lactamase superfamily)
MNDPTATITVIGGPTVLIELGGVRLLTDLTFDDAGSRYALGPLSLSKLRGPAVSVDDLGRIDAVLLSHDEHPDNLDHAGRALLAQVPLVVTTPTAAARLGTNAIGLPAGGRVEVPGPDSTVTVTAVAAVHGPAAMAPMLGEVTGFLAQRGPHVPAVYVSGDNVSLDAVSATLACTPVGLAVLHAGAARFPRLGPAALSFSGADTVEAARALGDCPVIVVHDEGWDHFVEDPEAVVAAFARVGLPDRLLSPSPGVATIVPLLPARR